MKQKKIIIRILTGILTIGIMGLIFSFSAQNGEESSGLSDKIVTWVQNICISIFQIQDEETKQIFTENLSFVIRKLAHFTIYATLGMSATGFFLTFPSISTKKQYLFAWMLGTVYAMTDEFHQLFSPGRSGQITDVILDSVGVLFGLGIIYVFQKIFMKRERKESY